jgi:hypothetical protein
VSGALPRHKPVSFPSLHASSLLERVIGPCVDPVSAIVFSCCQKAAARNLLLCFSFRKPRGPHRLAHPDWVWHVCYSYTAKRKRMATSCLDG